MKSRLTINRDGAIMKKTFKGILELFILSCHSIDVLKGVRPLHTSLYPNIKVSLTVGQRRGLLTLKKSIFPADFRKLIPNCDTETVPSWQRTQRIQRKTKQNERSGL